MTTDVELITVHASADLEGVPRVYSLNVYLPEADFPDSDAWQPVLVALAENLTRVKPRQDLVFWIHEFGNGEVSLGMTSPGRSSRELRPLLRGGPAEHGSSGRGYLADDPRPVLKWDADGTLIRLWPHSPTPDAPESLGAAAVVNRQFRVVGWPGDEGGRAPVVRPAAGTPMRLETIDIENVMRFERFEATFAPSFTVVIGDNGTGKTTLLTLLKRVLAAWTPSEPRATAGKDFVRETLHVENGAPYRQPHEPWHLAVLGQGPDGLPLDHKEHDGQDIVGNVRAGRLHRAANADVHVPLPVLAYFSPWREPPRKRKPRIKPSGVHRRLDGYVDALDLHADFTDFAGWFKGFEMQRALEGERVPAVEAVRETVIQCIPGCTSFRLVPKLDEIVVTIDGTTHPIWRLSDGFRTMLALVGEIAWRAAVLNPALGAQVARDVSGVVLIDELDLHLHPRWQRRVVDDLRNAFPRIQFIATTHSPFVVQSMRDGEVVNLDDRPPMHYWREGIEDIATESMGVEDGRRSALYNELEAVAAEYYELLDTRPAETELITAKRSRLDELEAHFTDNPALAAFLRSHRLAAKGGE